MRVTVGQILINEALPPELRDYNRVLDKKGLKELLREVYERAPEHYRETVKALTTVGADVAYNEAHSVSVASLRPPKEKFEIVKRMKEAADVAYKKNVIGGEEEAQQAMVAAMRPFIDELKTAVFDKAVEEGNPLALQISSGARGNKGGLNSLIGADVLYTDGQDRPIPLPVMNSYSEGLSPAEYWAGAYGARKGTVDTKLATAKAGFFGKQISQAAHRLVVTSSDCETELGVPVETSDKDNIGALMARGESGVERNEALTTRDLTKMKNGGVKEILVRSPMTCEAKQGVCAKCAGIRDRGRLPSVGDHIGINAAQALSERLSQGQLCLVEHTMVRMADWSVKAIETVVVGDMVLGCDAGGNTFPARVVNVYSNGYKQCQRTTFKVGLSRDTVVLDSTADHKILCNVKKWSCSGQTLNDSLQIFPVGKKAKDFNAVFAERFVEPLGLVDEPYALAIGLMLGDGCCTRKAASLLFSCADDSLLNDIQPLLAPLNLRVRRRHGHPFDCIIGVIVDPMSVHRRTDGTMQPGWRNPLKLRLEAYEILGKYAHEKCLPATVDQWTNRAIANLICGLVVTDGSIVLSKQAKGKPYINFASTSKIMRDGVRRLLAWRFGIYSTASTHSGAGRKRPLYCLDVATRASIEKFYSAIPLLGVKRLRLSQAMQTWKPEKPEKFFRLKRQSQVAIGERLTYDIEVDHKDHLFVLANGLIVSNSSKHSGGVIGAAQSVTGFDLINQLVQVPTAFKGGAAIADLDGHVTSVTEAPQGGTYIDIGRVKHWVPPGLESKVKVGSVVEAGDVLSEGIPNPARIVAHKGIGEGRRYFTQQFAQAFRDSGMQANRRNVELVARGLINHVRVIDEDASDVTVPNDLVDYDSLVKKYQPRMGTTPSRPNMALGRYLEKPVMHYSIGTRITPSVVKRMQQHKVDSVLTHGDEPSFQPEMHRAMEVLTVAPDWQERLGGFYLGRGFQQAVHKGMPSTTESTSYIPRVAQGKPLFGAEEAVRISPVI